MLRVVVDPNVVVSAAICPSGVTGRLIRIGLTGPFRIVVCPMLLQEAMACRAIGMTTTSLPLSTSPVADRLVCGDADLLALSTNDPRIVSLAPMLDELLAL